MWKSSVVRMAALVALTGALACGGGGEAVDAEGTADTEALQHNPDPNTGSPEGGGAPAGSQAPTMGPGDAVNAQGTADTQPLNQNPDSTTGTPASGGGPTGGGNQSLTP